jgi:hypothetical protein
MFLLAPHCAFKRSAHFGWQLDRLEVFLRVKVVFALLVYDAKKTIYFGIRIRKSLVDLPDL